MVSLKETNLFNMNAAISKCIKIIKKLSYIQENEIKYKC